MSTEQEAPLITKAQIVWDTKEQARQFGTRAIRFTERRLLYATSRAQVELRVPLPSTREDESWLCGQYVPADASDALDAPPLMVRITDEAGAVQCAAGSDTGDFVLPCDPSRPFTLQCEASGEIAVLCYRP